MASKTLASLVVKIGADVTGVTAGLSTLDKRVRSSKKQFSSITDSTLRWHSALGLLAGAAGVGYALKRVFDLGAGIEETASKFRTVFGPAAQETQKFLDEFANSAGLTNAAAQEIVATTGAIAQGMGFGQKASAEFAEQITRLAGDLTSFNNVPIAETSRAIQSALTGERESLKRLGIVILETDVQKRALADRSAGVTGALTQQEKATATLALISERAGVSVGDLARTMESPANKARRIAAEFGDLRDDISTGLLPAMGAILEELEGTSGGFDKIGMAVKANAPVIAEWARFTLAALKTVSAAIAFPIVLAYNLGEVIGKNLVASVQIMTLHWRGASKTLKSIPGDFGDMAAAAMRVVDGFTEMREKAGDAFSTFAAAPAAFDAVTTSVEATTTALESMASMWARLREFAKTPLTGPNISGLGFDGLEKQVAKWKAAQQEIREGNITLFNNLTPSTAAPTGANDPGTQSLLDKGREFVGSIGETLGEGMDQLWAKMGPAGLAIAALFDIVKGALEPLRPVIDALREPLRIIGTLIGQSLAPVLELLVPIVNALAIAFTFGQQAVGYLVQALGWLIDHLVPDFISKVGQGIEQYGKDMVANSKEARRALGAANNATNEFAKALNNATSNVPQALPLAFLRQQAGMANPPGTPKSPNGPIVPGDRYGNGPVMSPAENETWNIVINGALNAQETAQAVMDEIRRAKGRGQSIELDRHYQLRPA